jgi:hypothetical protein
MPDTIERELVDLEQRTPGHGVVTARWRNTYVWHRRCTNSDSKTGSPLRNS